MCTSAKLAIPLKRHAGGPASKPRKVFEGTPEYLSPEQINAFLLGYGPDAMRKASGFPSDVFALAVSVKEVLTGVVPYTDLERAESQLYTVVDNSYTPRALCQAVATDGVRPTLWDPTVGHFAVGDANDAGAASVDLTDSGRADATLLEAAWGGDRTSRPTSAILLKQLDALFFATPAASPRGQTPR
jgi:serine/threonine protein kinase